jgi:hypothetical protein
VEPEPEPIVEPEPEPAPEPEPEPEPVVAPEPEAVAEPEPEVIPEPEAEEAPVDTEEAPAPAEEPVEEEEEPVEEEEEEQTYEPAVERKGANSWLVALLALALGVAGGYFLGSYYPYSKLVAPSNEVTVINVQKADVVAEKPAAQPAAETEAEPEPQAEAQQADVKTEPQPAAKPEVKPEAKPEPKPAAQPEAKKAEEPKAEANLDKWSQMDQRVRYGAYRIVGTDKVVKVKEGDNIVKISRRILGPDMECYIEVFNNMKASTPLKVGQEIKIPKLELKKKKKAATAN